MEKVGLGLDSDSNSSTHTHPITKEDKKGLWKGWTPVKSPNIYDGNVFLMMIKYNCILNCCAVFKSKYSYLNRLCLTYTQLCHLFILHFKEQSIDTSNANHSNETLWLHNFFLYYSHWINLEIYMYIRTGFSIRIEIWITKLCWTLDSVEQLNNKIRGNCCSTHDKTTVWIL